MDWAMLGAIGELIGALAVILSLLYVGRQVQNSNTMARSAVRQELSSEANTWAMSIASQPGLAATFAKVHFGGLTRRYRVGASPGRLRLRGFDRTTADGVY